MDTRVGSNWFLCDQLVPCKTVRDSKHPLPCAHREPDSRLLYSTPSRELQSHSVTVRWNMLFAFYFREDKITFEVKSMTPYSEPFNTLIIKLYESKPKHASVVRECASKGTVETTTNSTICQESMFTPRHVMQDQEWRFLNCLKSNCVTIWRSVRRENATLPHGKWPQKRVKTARSHQSTDQMEMELSFLSVARADRNLIHWTHIS